MKIRDLVCSGGKTGFFFDDQKAIKTNAVPDGAAYMGEPLTPGFTKVRQAGESVSIMLILEDGQVALGDCAAVQYSGAGGRDPLFLAKDFIPIIEKEIKPLLVGKELTGFKPMATMLDGYRDASGNKLHTAIRYGVTQAVLSANALASKKLMAQTIAAEYGLQVSNEPIPIFCQTGDDRYLNADKIILKGAQVLPHALINNVKDKLGLKGEKLLEYVEWLSERIKKLRVDESYSPVMHIDVYGTLGIAFENDFEKITDYLGTLEKAAAPFKLRIEGPVDVGERTRQMEALAEICRKLGHKGVDVEIVADEWCNTFEDVVYFTDNKAGHMVQIKTPDLGGINNSIEAVIYCRQKGMGAYLGGTCNETDVSGRACVHVAMAVKPVQCLAKPGMGVDEGYMIAFNEMRRILALKDVL